MPLSLAAVSTLLPIPDPMTVVPSAVVISAEEESVEDYRALQITMLRWVEMGESFQLIVSQGCNQLGGRGFGDATRS